MMCSHYGPEKHNFRPQPMLKKREIRKNKDINTSKRIYVCVWNSDRGGNHTLSKGLLLAGGFAAPGNHLRLHPIQQGGPGFNPCFLGAMWRGLWNVWNGIPMAFQNSRGMSCGEGSWETIVVSDKEFNPSQNLSNFLGHRFPCDKHQIHVHWPAQSPCYHFSHSERCWGYHIPKPQLKT